MPYFSTKACDTVIAKAKENIDTILKDNVKQILHEVNDKMNKDAVVVLNGYAQFFNTANNDCVNQAWDAFWFIPGRRIATEKLTTKRREQFNDLVLGINRVLREATNEIAADDKIRYKIGFSDWDPWVHEGVDGQMCSPSSNGDYPDPKQPEMQFIKPDTHPWFNWRQSIHDELRKRELTEHEVRVVEHLETTIEARRELEDKRIFDSLLFKSPNPGAEILHQLDARAPAPPGCPGDDSKDFTFGLGLPDSIGRNFHPNENGHVTIASFAMAEAMDLRSLSIDAESPACELTDEFTCWSNKGFKAYASASRLDAHYEQFCNSVVQPQHTKGWRFEKTYDAQTPDEHWFVVELSGNAADFNKDECYESMRNLIHNCDTKSKMNWKHGGKYVRGETTYEVNVRKANRPWPPPESPVGRCAGWYKVFFGSYEIEGGGFSTWDWGQKTMLPNMNGCYGRGTTKWKFHYYDKPTREGYEWKATFRTPIWVRARCFKNNKVVKGAGGWTNGCSGND